MHLTRGLAILSVLLPIAFASPLVTRDEQAVDDVSGVVAALATPVAQASQSSYGTNAAIGGDGGGDVESTVWNDARLLNLALSFHHLLHAFYAQVTDAVPSADAVVAAGYPSSVYDGIVEIKGLGDEYVGSLQNTIKAGGGEAVGACKYSFTNTPTPRRRQTGTDGDDEVTPFSTQSIPDPSTLAAEDGIHPPDSTNSAFDASALGALEAAIFPQLGPLAQPSRRRRQTNDLAGSPEQRRQDGEGGGYEDGGDNNGGDDSDDTFGSDEGHEDGDFGGDSEEGGFDDETAEGTFDEGSEEGGFDQQLDEGGFDDEAEEGRLVSQSGEGGLDEESEHGFADGEFDEGSADDESAEGGFDGQSEDGELNGESGDGGADEGGLGNFEGDDGLAQIEYDPKGFERRQTVDENGPAFQLIAFNQLLESGALDALAGMLPEDYVRALGEIMATHARAAAWIASVNGETVAKHGFEDALTPDLALKFLDTYTIPDSCPTSNAALLPVSTSAN